jgi:hypothetical protein
MNVKAWSNGKGVYGIRIGGANREKFFNPQWRQITVEIGGAPRLFKLTAGFWKDCPEFRDSGAKWIERWLRDESAVPWPPYQPPSYQLVPTGEKSFRLST